MLQSLNHLAIAVPDLKAAIAHYRDVLGMTVSDPHDLPEHGVRVSVIDLPNVKIELMEPLGDTSPLTGFLEKNTSGGLHHMCFDVDSMADAQKMCTSRGVRILGDGEPKIGFHGNPVLFLHPKDNCGVLVELEES